MLKILLVDTDTENIRNFKTFIKKIFPETKIFECTQPAGLFDDVKKLLPDLVIMDIRFPGSAFYSVISDIYEYNPALKYIVYGYYNDTQYIESVMRFGVIDYVYRPVRPADFERALRKAAVFFDDIEFKKRDKVRVKARVNEKKSEYRDIFLRSLIDGSIENDSEIKKNFLYFGIELKAPYCVIMLKIDQFKSMVASLDEEEKHSMVYRIGEIIQNKLTAFGGGVAFTPKFNIGVIITGGISDVRGLFSLAKEIKTEITLQSGQSVTLGIGRCSDRPSGIACSFREADAALRHRYYVGHNTVIPIAYAEPDNVITYKYLLENEEKLVYAAVCGEYEYCLELLRRLIDSLKDKELPPNLLSKIIMDIVISINRFVTERDNRNFDNFMEFFPTGEMLKISGAEDAYNYMSRALSQFCECMNGMRRKKAVLFVEKAKNYIEINFTQNISLSEIAHKVEAVPEYFAKSFMELENCSVFEYVTKVRVRKSKSLLLETRLDEDTIAQTVGFADHGHFRIVFRQYEGVYPSEYRRRQGERQ